MAASIFNPLSDDLINLINTFAKTSAILEGDNIPSSHDVHEATSLNLGAFLHQFWNHAEPQPSISTTDVETLSQALAEMSLDESGQPSSHHVSKKRETSSDASKAALDGVAAEVQVLRDALREPVQAINALIAMYIIQSFDEPLLEVLTPTQCAQLFEAICLADIVSELDKQLRVLRAVADDHRRVNDPHLQLVQEIKAGLVRTFSDVRSFTSRHANIQIPGQQVMLDSHHDRGDLLSLDDSIERMYTSLQGQGDVLQHLIWEQERTIIALKIFLEDKIEKFQQRHAERRPQPSDGSRYVKDWPSATIPSAQLATILLSSMLTHLVEATNLPTGPDVPQDPTPSTEPVMETKGKAPATPSSPLAEHHSEPESPIAGTATPATVIGPSEIFQPSVSPALPRSVSPEIFTSSSPAPHVKFYLPKLLDKRRDSAISLLSSTGQPEKIDIQDDETLPDSDGSECGEHRIMFEPDVTTEIETVDSLPRGTQESTEVVPSFQENTIENNTEPEVLKHDEKGKGPATIDSSVKNEIAVDNSSPNISHEEPAEDLYSAEDLPALTRLDPIPEEQEPEGTADARSGSTPPQATPSPDITTSYATPFLSTHWPQRAWLQTVLSILTPAIEAHPASPLSPSFNPEVLSSTPANTSGSEWYSRYDSWWSSAMRGASGQRGVDEDSESTVTSASHHSWGAGSRSTADSIDV